MRALAERITLLLGRSCSVALASFGHVPVLTPPLAGCVDESEHGLDQAISRNAERKECGCAKRRFGSHTVFVAKDSARSECRANRAYKSDEQGGADRESTRWCGGSASRGVGIHGCVRHPISTCVD